MPANVAGLSRRFDASRSRRFHVPALAWSQGREPPDLSIELIDPNVFRVCADPHNLPFSNEQGEGFENKLAAMLAAKLGKRLGYAWYPQATGFVRNTLGAHRCDVIMGFPAGGRPRSKHQSVLPHRLCAHLQGRRRPRWHRFACRRAAEAEAYRRRRRHATGHLSCGQWFARPGRSPML